MSSALAVFAVGGTALILLCVTLMFRSGRCRSRRTHSPDGGSDGLTYAGADSGSHFWSWFGSGDSLFGSAGHSGGSDSAGGDSTGGGDSGGGGDGGGGDGGGGGD